MNAPSSTIEQAAREAAKAEHRMTHKRARRTSILQRVLRQASQDRDAVVALEERWRGKAKRAASDVGRHAWKHAADAAAMVATFLRNLHGEKNWPRSCARAWDDAAQVKLHLVDFALSANCTWCADCASYHYEGHGEECTVRDDVDRMHAAYRIHLCLDGLKPNHWMRWLEAPLEEPCDRCGDGEAEHSDGNGGRICNDCTDALNERHAWGDA